MNDRGIYHRALAQQQAVCAQVGIDRVEQVGREAVALQQTPEVEDGGLIGQRLQQRQLRKLAQRRNLVQRLRSEEHTSELQSLMRISYAVFCLKKKKNNKTTNIHIRQS